MNVATANQAANAPGFNEMQLQAMLNQLRADATAPVPSGDYWVHDLNPVAWHIDIGGFGLDLRWYSLAYLAGIVIGWIYMLRLIRQPGAPMARRHADDFVFYVTLGVIIGGRLGYVLFYRPLYYMDHLVDIVKLWDGGMSFHGGLIGATLAALYLARANKLSFLRVGDYACACAPFGLFFGRLANFVNGELWGRPSDVPWAVQFHEIVSSTRGSVEIIGPPRHPSQLYEAGLEGLLLFAVLAGLFWFTRARYKPGFLAGAFIFGYGLCRFTVEFFRMPDAHLVEFARITHLSMGQWLTVPMLLLGLYLMLTARKRDPIYADVAAEAAPEPVAQEVVEGPAEPPAEPA